MLNRSTVLILVAALAAALGLLAAQKYTGQPARPLWPQTQAVTLLHPPRELPAFSLRQSDGTTLSPDEIGGHWTLVFLGFTHCPDICPTTLLLLAQAQKQWESLPAPSRPRVLFVSVDPERDTPDRIGQYARGFHRDTLAATATSVDLAAFTGSLSLVFARVPPDNGAPADQYTVDHSAAMALIDPQGRMAGLVQSPFDPETLATDLSALTAASGISARATAARSQAGTP